MAAKPLRNEVTERSGAMKRSGTMDIATRAVRGERKTKIHESERNIPLQAKARFFRRSSGFFRVCPAP